MDAIGLLGQTLVDLQERDDVFHAPEVLRRTPPTDVPVHGVLKQDAAKDTVTVEARTRNNPTAHFMHQSEHLVVA